MMGGWSSFNKYSLLGAMRAAAQVVSYELPLLLAPVGVIMLSGTLSLNGIVTHQSGWFWNWYVFQQPLAFIVFFIAATAEGNRTPFDLTEADSEIVAGFATEYSGMRFGFFFFAEYVNVFILSALTVMLFLGGWNAPIDPRPILDFLHIAINPALDLASMGVWLLWVVVIGVPLVVLAVSAVIWMLKSDWSFIKSLVVGFMLFNIVAAGVIGIWLFMSFEVVVGLFWFTAKVFTFVFIYVWMRATLPRVRIDQLMGFAWKWLVEIALLNIFVTAGRHPADAAADGRVTTMSTRSSMSFARIPGWRHRQGHARHACPLLPAQGHRPVPRGRPADLAAQPWPVDPALRRSRQPQVRDLLPVRHGVPDRDHRHGRR